MKSKKPIETLWNTYRGIMPPDCSATQIIETRRAFYAGAQALFHVVLNNVSSGDEVEEADLKMMDAIHDELHAFAVLVGKGVA